MLIPISNRQHIKTSSRQYLKFPVGFSTHLSFSCSVFNLGIPIRLLRLVSNFGLAIRCLGDLKIYHVTFGGMRIFIKKNNGLNVYKMAKKN